MKIKKGDKVKVISGKDKGKISSVLKVLSDKNQLVVEGVEIVKRHVKPGAVSKEGGIISVEKPIDASNVMYYDEKSKKTVRIGYKVVDGKKYRINKKTGDILDKK
ncbi:MAG: 50S ribosomal protein L24 [Patescibacteria group bacterium]